MPTPPTIIDKNAASAWRTYYCQNCGYEDRFKTENPRHVFVICWECTSTLQRFYVEEPEDPPGWRTSVR